MASRFWKAQPASAIADNGSGKCRVTVASTTGMTTGDTRLFFGFTGTTGLNGSQTITVIDGTHLDVTAVSFVATGTGSINGFWDTANTNNWVSSSGGTDYGQTVPGSGDFVTLDANSGAGTVTPNFGGTITIQSIAMGAFTGTFDNSVNSNNITCSNTSQTFNISGSGTRTIKLGSATYTITGAGIWNAATTTNLTFTGDSSTIAFASAGARTFSGGGLTYGTVSVAAGTAGGGLTIVGTNTIAALNVSAPNYVAFPSSGSNTLTSMNCAGTPTNQIIILPSSALPSSCAITVSGAIGTWCSLFGVHCTGSPTASNSFDCGGNSGITITAPSSGMGGYVIGS
ncbi:hypothetical protein ACVIHI_002664 [Bradyrhizobium sp. USDA 4524]|uniref:hypothetical protein n=1 Tax=unclassified Bradyrhizobium TaxID=2631580 RepID=UPI00209C78F7|nr:MULTISPECIES: hypothetical protein [unclassified Bradyrhizobium]MCP1844415.1 hypothetical protein [Bradyrhizobium sp. USDA 4538]MCP1904981.1 hypothetical protein [Bradyrhizobium sp. USDA 4537]MCP1989363.1 hypothetical protein [Bradyrhizobium sp. USDA 4539]